MSQLRFWRNTSIASGNGGTLTNLLGYEWDSDLDNGFRPAGLIDLSSTTRNVSTLLLDNGSTTGPGTATHSLTLYRDTTSGALVFGAGTVMWSWGLSNQYAPYHGLTAPVSAAVQQSMVNLFADMGVQPQTLQASLVLAQASTDHTAPTAVITSPTGGTSFSQGQTVTITGTASDVGGRVAGIEVSTDGGTTWHPATGTTNWSYTWTASGPGTHVIEARATDDSVNLQSISFVASDPDNAILSLASPFASAFGNPAITSGATSSLTPSAQTTAVSGTLQVMDGSFPADVVGLDLGTAGNDTTAPNPTSPNAMYGFGGNDTLTGAAAADSIFGGAGADTLGGSAGNDTFYLANGDFASGESIDGGLDTDAIVLTNATTVNFTSGTVSNVETLTGSSGNDTITMSATQWAGFSTINLGSGTNVLNVVASGDISAQPTPTVSNVTTGNLTGTSGNDTMTLTGAQLDAIIIGAGTINLGTGTDTINLTSTSADLNTLGATNNSIQGVEAISAAGSGVIITLSGQTEEFTITGSSGADTITAGSGMTISAVVWAPMLSLAARARTR